MRRTQETLYPISLAASAGALAARFAFDPGLIGDVTFGIVQGVVLVLCWRQWLDKTTDGKRRGSIDVALSAAVALTAWFLRGEAVAAATAFATYALASQVWQIAVAACTRMEALANAPRQLARFASGCWMALALGGAILLALPAASHPAVPDYAHNFWRHILACAFTSASAVSLNGAAVYNTGEDLRAFGQAVIYGLMQCGAVLFLTLGLIALRPWLVRPMRLGALIWIWLGLQAVGIGVTWGLWMPPGGGNESRPLWSGMFHVASALNGGGFALRQEGLASYLAHGGEGPGRVYWVMLFLCAIGSIGLVIIWDRVRVFADWITGRLQARSGPLDGLRDLMALELHLGIWIICIGAAVIWLLETPSLLPAPLAADPPIYVGVGQCPLSEMVGDVSSESSGVRRLLGRFGPRWHAALLMSASARSAGLHVAPLTKLAISWPTWLFLIVLMMLGGAAGSTAGGMRTGVLTLLLYRSRFRQAAPGASRADREASPQTRVQAIPRMGLRLIAVMLAVNVAGILLLWATQQVTLWESAFDAVSLTNGVGWTTGLTPILNPFGRLAGIVLMFGGRMIPVLAWCWIATMLPAAAARPVQTAGTKPQR